MHDLVRGILPRTKEAKRLKRRKPGALASSVHIKRGCRLSERFTGQVVREVSLIGTLKMVCAVVLDLFQADGTTIVGALAARGDWGSHGAVEVGQERVKSATIKMQRVARRP